MQLEPLKIWVPQGDKSVLLYQSLPHQSEFHQAPEDNVILEGGKGTGKSLAIRMDAHWRAQYPGFKYLILRRTMPALRRTHLGFIEAEMKKFGGIFHKTENTAYYPNGSKGYFGHCETEADILNYLSSEFGAIYFDELSTFSLKMFLDISSCARAPEDVPYVAVVRGGTNPIGEGSGWVKTWFIDKKVNFIEFPDYNPNDFKAIHSIYTDNPHINQTAYKGRLQNLSKHERDAYLAGRWIDVDGYFADWSPSKLVEEPEGCEATDEATPWHVIESLPTVKGESLLKQPWVNIYRVMDWGWFPDPAVCLWIAVLPSGRAIVFKEMHWNSTTAKEVAQKIKAESKDMKVIATYCDPTMFDGSKASDGVSIGDIIDAEGVFLTASTNNRSAIGAAIHQWLNTNIEDGKPKIQVLRNGAPNLIRTFPDMKTTKGNPSRIDDGEDHYVIALGYFCQSDILASREPSVPVIPRWMQPKTNPATVLGNKNVRRA